MNNIEYAWVIQRDDGKFFNCAGSSRNYETYFVDSLFDAQVFSDRFVKEFNQCENVIKIRHLQNCKPVKIKIMVVEDE